MKNKFIISAVIAACLILTGLWMAIDVEETTVPRQNEMRDGCVHQKSGDNWVRTCG